ncbi:MAG: hypothetical protein J7604_25705 [Sporocytophaga sp.]|uniref:hypothetical protein n=1 Tax=Sporocytophaga sp. TaxID=2231183 RepID=UPI001B1CDC7F|nr:hypothetical protein [Sporocytophaga sp.]MBO9703626.1 hypothetical protein [Sporocytophaga sp.]
MTNVLKLSQCGKVVQNEDFNPNTGSETESKYECTGRCDQHKDQKDVTKSLNEIILKQLFF